MSVAEYLPLKPKGKEKKPWKHRLLWTYGKSDLAVGQLES